MYLLVSIFSLKKETSCRETNFSNSKKNLSPSAIVVLTSAATLVISIVVLFSFLFSWVFCVPNKNLIKSNKKSNHTSIYVNQFINLYANCFKEKKNNYIHILYSRTTQLQKNNTNIHTFIFIIFLRHYILHVFRLAI